MKKIKLIIIITLVLLIKCINVNAQTIEDGTYVMSSALDTNKVIDLSGGVVRNAGNIQLYTYNGSAAQQWNIKYNSQGYYTITSSATW